MAFNRRHFLIGMGGAIVGLPFLEGLAKKEARADAVFPPYALFYRRGNGVQQALFNRNPTAEPERWWPSAPFGALTPGNIGADRAIGELATYASKLCVVRGLRHPVGTQNGHREGFIQGLTGAGVKYPNNIPDVFSNDPLGESLDNRIARELTPTTPTSLFMGLGAHDLGGVSFLHQKDAAGKQLTRAADENLLAVYNRLFLSSSGDAQAKALLQTRRISVNDLVRDNLTSLKNDPRLSKADQDRLGLHMDAIRDTEVALSCVIPPALQGDTSTYQIGYQNDPDWFKGNSVTQCGAIMGRLAALAIVCGATRSVLINMGPPQDTTPYNQVTTPAFPANAANIDFHSISHRQSQDGNPATNITNAQLMHHSIDRFHLTLFRGILDQLASYSMSDGSTLLDKGVCVHYSDLGSGQHEITQLPYLYVGGAGGALKTGLYVNATDEYLVKFLNSIGAAVGVKNGAGGQLDNLNADNNGGINGRLLSIANT